jgi:chromate transporter
VAAVAVQAGLGLVGPSWRRAIDGARRAPWLLYAVLGAAVAAAFGSYLVLVLLACGLIELFLSARARSALGAIAPPAVVPVLASAVVAGGIGAVAWVAFKVGALSYGGGFVIVPLMQHDAVHTYHWMTSTQFLNAVALGQVTPGPVVATVAAVGYAAHGVGGAALGALIAFLPSFAFVLLLGRRFNRLRASPGAQSFLAGAGPAAIGAIIGAAIPLAAALAETWQVVLLAGAAVALLVLRVGIVATLVGCGVVGAIIGLSGGSLPH